jgi:hypothetical protein
LRPFLPLSGIFLSVLSAAAEHKKMGVIAHAREEARYTSQEPIGIPIVCRRAIRARASGTRCPLAHRETVACVRPTRTATAAIVSFRFAIRRFRISLPASGIVCAG